MTTNLPPLAVLDLGLRPYGETLELQRELAGRRAAGAIGNDLLLLVEHDPVITLGRGSKPESLPVPRQELERLGVAVFEVERGGDVTFHGPGQLVGYPILDLGGHRRDLHWYLRQLEAALIGGLAGLGIEAERHPGFTGVWTRGRKIVSIGIHVRQWVTFHGFALNVTTDLQRFELIVPCGIRGVEMTSVARERGTGGRWERSVGDEEAALLRREARDAVIKSLGETFGRSPVGITLEELFAPQD
ncbi:MAG: lipoyl(octanoyl) transferase LipB [Gemmatimonadales bacterium]